MFKKLKDKKGFTLVELIVVLVILAILAALLIPTLTGYIDKANKEKVVAETRMVAMAVQTELSEAYGQAGSGNQIKVETWAATSDHVNNIKPETWAATSDHVNNIIALAEVIDTTKTPFAATATADGKLTTVTYNNGSYTCTYDASKKTYTSKKNETSDTALTNTVVINAAG